MPTASECASELSSGQSGRLGIPLRNGTSQRAVDINGKSIGIQIRDDAETGPSVPLEIGRC